MKPRLTARGIVIFAAVLGGTMLLMNLLAQLFDKGMNTARRQPPYPVRAEIAQLHQRLFVADLHADTLLWNRDLLNRHSRGHVDLPRLVEGNVAFQVFGVVTQVPWGLNFESNPSNSDMVPLLAVAQLWPPRTWFSLAERAIYQAQKLERFANRSQGTLVLVRSQSDLESLLFRRQAGEQVVGSFPALEGVHALEGKMENLDRLYSAGFRMLGMTHFFDNQAAGSAHGTQQHGLTPFGMQLVRRSQELGMILDLAHAAPQVIEDVLAITQGPVIVSHSGVRGTCDNQRNLSDGQVRRIAATGGVIGVAMFDTAVCGETIEDTARAIRYIADLVGADHAAVGSDFDGTITAPIDTSGMPALTQALVDQGFSEAEIEKIMGGNFLRVLQQVLPE